MWCGELREVYRVSGESFQRQWTVPHLSQCGRVGSVPRATTGARSILRVSFQTTNRGTGQADAIGDGVCARINGCHGVECSQTDQNRQQTEDKREVAHGRIVSLVRKGGGESPRMVSPLNPAGDPLTLAEGQQAGVFDPTGTQFVALDQSLLRHPLKGQGEGGTCLIGHPQRLIDVGRAHPVLIGATAAVIHGQQGQDRPLVGSAECFAVGESGEHGSVV